MSITNAVKKMGATLAAVAAIALAATPSQAAFVSIAKSTVTASVNLTTIGTVTMAAPVLKFRATNLANSGSIGFGTVSLPSGFVISDSYIQVNSAITAYNGGIQIYTNNTAAGALPRFLPTPNGANMAGLVSSDGQSNLPMAWSVKPSTATPPTVNTPNQTGQPTTDPNFEWEYIEDHAQLAAPGIAAFANADPYITVKKGTGLQVNTGTFSTGGGQATAYIYSEADFTAATTPNTYGTNEITLEAFTN